MEVLDESFPKFMDKNFGNKNVTDVIATFFAQLSLDF